nr:reverse transcriptase domain, reverse transcriptase zinc-binding domain protein [Tanacetum cinerariifolium]
MVNMVPHEAFACSCAEGDVVLRQSYKPESCGKLYYACPKSKHPKHFGCGFFMERNPTSSIDEFSWSSICRTFNTSKLFFRIFKKCRIIFPLQESQLSTPTGILPYPARLLLCFVYEEMDRCNSPQLVITLLGLDGIGYFQLKSTSIHSWILGLDRLPTRCNLNARGIDIDSTRCPVCNEGQETSCHLFIECPVGLWNMVSAWWSCGDFPKDSHSLLVWGDNINFSNSLKSCFDVVVQTTTWIIWRYRNQICFDLKPPRKDTLGEEIKVLSHCWILHRNRKLNPLWLDWVFDPIKDHKNSL